MGKMIFSAIAVFAILIFGGVTQAAKSPTYVGLTGCKCHKAEIDDWKKSPHAKAFELLSAKGRSKSNNKAMVAAKLDYKKDYTSDDKCLKCHTVGYGGKGGYFEEKDSAELGQAGCEVCHGAGSEYRDVHDKKGEAYGHAEIVAAGQLFPQEDEKICRKCHDSSDSPFNSKLDAKYMFNYGEMKKLTKAWHNTYSLKGKH